MNEKFDQLQQKIGVHFKNFDLLKNVFIHRSYLNENIDQKLESNERLEFLGDAVLELIVTEYMYLNYSEQEGILTNWRSALVRGQNLAKLSEKFNLGDYLFLSKGEEKTGGRKRELLLANTFEALIGAMYLDQGYEVTKEFLMNNIIVQLPEIISKNLHLDPKTTLQELVQEKLNITPTYEVLASNGPDHAKIFEVGVFVNEKMLGQGNGSNKQTAQSKAAEAALEKFKNEPLTTDEN
jgi:ribonuclease-3